MIKTEYQEKIEKEMERLRIEKARQHKIDKENKKAMTAKLKLIKRRIRETEKRIMKLHQRVREDRLLLLKIRGGGTN